MNRKTKKLLVVSGGRSIHTYNLISLVGDYFSQTMLLTDYENEKYPKIKKCITDFSFRNPIKILQSIRTIKRLLKTFKPDFVICYQVDTAAFITMLCKPKRVPSLIMAMGSDILLNQYKGLPYRMLIRYVLNRAKYYNTGALHVANEMKRLANKDIEVVVANLGFEPDISPADKQNIIFSNRLHKPLYQIPLILKAFAKFYNDHSDWRLVIAGSGNEENLKRLAKELGIEQAVEFTGWLDREVNNHFYAISRLWVSIPLSDCTPISLMEAMAGGCVPVVSDLPPMHEWIEDGKTGIIVSDFESNFLQRALQLDYDHLQQINLELVKAKGSKDINREKFYEIFDKEFCNGTR